MTRFLLILTVLPALLLTGCIDGEETTWLEPDGSGRVAATYRLPDLVVSRLGGLQRLTSRLKTAIDADPEIHLEKIGHDRGADGRVNFFFSARFDDFRSLIAFPERRLRDPAAPDTPVPEEALFGTMILEINALKLDLYREVNLAPILPEAIRSSPGLLGESTLTYRVHMPVPTGDSNATKVSPDGKTLEWSFLLRDHTNHPMILTSRAELPLPWWIWCTAVLVGIVFIAILFLAARRMILMRR